MTKSASTLSVALGLFLMLAVPFSARAQDATTPPPPPAGGSALAGGMGIGAGASRFLSGLNGVAGVYDAAKFHVEGIFGFNRFSSDAANVPSITFIQFGVRGWYHLHHGTRSDFSLGGGMGLVTQSGGNNPPSATLLEPAAQARVFLTPNFTLQVTAGFSFVFGDSVGQTGTARGFSLGSQFMGDFGFTYFFG